MKPIIGIGEAESEASLNFGQSTAAEQWMQTMLRQWDPFGIVAPIANAQSAWLTHPLEWTRASAVLWQNSWRLGVHAMKRLSGVNEPDLVLPHPDDTRFRSPEWSGPYWGLLKEIYLASTRMLQDLCFEAPGLSYQERRRAAFWLRNLINAVSPSNGFLTNPDALKRYRDSKGESLRQGLDYWRADLENKNLPMVEPGAFVVGKDLATTVGDVVFRNELIEVIYYQPTTAKVDAKPIVIVPPWINKFYILDLTPAKSMVKYLVDQGFAVFLISWKNPSAEQSGLRFDDYLSHGVAEAVRVARAYYSAEAVHLVGYCLGGTLVSTYMAWLAKDHDESPVADWTLLTTLTDFSSPGDIEVFLDSDTLAALDNQMQRQGFLSGDNMAAAFRLLRPNSLIWHYWVHRYLLGEPLPAFDVLFWNMDKTRMPATMHRDYLHHMYKENRLVKSNQLTVAERQIDLGAITAPLYAVTAEDDHIAPWQQCYRLRKYLAPTTPMRFVLSSSGHILGIVNPPVDPPKRHYAAGEAVSHQRHQGWRESASEHSGSWWPDWVDWLRRDGEGTVKAQKRNSAWPSLAKAPGSYVFDA